MWKSVIQNSTKWKDECVVLFYFSGMSFGFVLEILASKVHLVELQSETEAQSCRKPFSSWSSLMVMWPSTVMKTVAHCRSAYLTAHMEWEALEMYHIVQSIVVMDMVERVSRKYYSFLLQCQNESNNIVQHSVCVCVRVIGYACSEVRSLSQRVNPLCCVGRSCGWPSIASKL